MKILRSPVPVIATFVLARPSRRRHLGFVLFVCCALLSAGVAWFAFSKPALRIEGEERISIADFGNGATVRHAFVMPVDGLGSVSVRISVDRL